MEYRYFISFYDNGKVSNTEIIRSKKIKSLEDIYDIQSIIERDRSTGIVNIISFILFED